MKTLVVGGSGFLGGAIANAALAAGHDVTVLCRNQPARPDVNHLAANRLHALDHLPAADFDFVFDTCAYTPGAISNVLRWAGPRLQRYVLISSISVYRDCSQQPSEDDSIPDASHKDLDVARKFEASGDFAAFGDWSSYGPLKRACEAEAERFLGSRAISLRAGLLIGPGDRVDRLAWWVRRMDLGGVVPVPAPPGRPVQLIDIRDVAKFTLRLILSGASGSFNTTSLPFTIESLLYTIAGLCPAPATPRWIDERRFLEAGVKPWTDVPYWLPQSGDTRCFLDVSVTRAFQSGLVTRPLRESIRDVLAWDRGRRSVRLSCGLSAEQERLLLQ